MAITSSIHPTSDTHIEPVRYGKGSNTMGLLQTLMTDGPGAEGPDETYVPRWRQLLNAAGEDPHKMLRLLNPRQWSERTMIALVVQHLDNSITTFTKRGKLGILWYSSKQGHRPAEPVLDPGSATRSPAALPPRSTASPSDTWGEPSSPPNASCCWFVEVLLIAEEDDLVASAGLGGSPR